MIKTVNATEAKNRFGKIIQQAYLYGQHLVIKRDAIPVVAIIPMSDYEQFLSRGQISNEMARSIKEERARLKLFALLKKVHKKTPSVSEKEVSYDIEKAIKTVRSRK